MNPEETKNANRILFDRLALLLNAKPDFVTSEMVGELKDSFGLSVDEAFSLLLCAALGFDTEREADRKLWENYSPHMIHHLDETMFINDPYYKAVRPEQGRTLGEWELREEILPAFEAFVCDDPLVLPDGRVIPQIGFFDTEYRYLSVLQNGREWMTMLPNELVTQRIPIKKAKGRVCTYGLGLGYFAFMCARKQEVVSVTVVERDESVIKLFNDLLLPAFENPEKIAVIQADAFDFAENEAVKYNFDYIFADIWHDPSDGVEAYKRFKQLERFCPNSKFDYWIEKTLKLYM